MDNNKPFYIAKDKTSVTSFIQIPKVLFGKKYNELPLKAKVAYSLYLSRYNATTYKDDRGIPFIIFSDAEMSKLIDTTKDYARKIRQRLEKANLIATQRTPGYSRIYLYSYEDHAADEDMFFYENTLDSWKFYRFPREFLDHKFSCLPLEAKFLYTLYFDSMCLSQANYYVDSKERIYFRDEIHNQIIKSGFSAPTLAKYRDYLKACHLLFEYQDFGKPIRYYLMKLPMFEDHVFEIETMTADERKKYIKQLNRQFTDKVISKKEERQISKLWKSLKEKKYTAKDLCSLFKDSCGKNVSVPGMRKYLNESRRMPDELYVFLTKLNGDMKQATENADQAQASANDDQADEPSDKKKENIIISQEADLSANEISTESKNDELASISEYFIMEAASLIPQDRKFVEDSIKELQKMNDIHLYNYGKTISRTEMGDLMRSFYPRAQAMIMTSLNAMENMSFATPKRRMKYFISVLFDKMEESSIHQWQNNDAFEVNRYLHSNGVQNNESADADVPDEIKNYKWW